MLKTIYEQHSEVVKNFFWRSAQLLGKQGVVFFIFVLCAKLLSKQDFGIYNYLLATVFILIMLGDFGISTATSKFVAEYELQEKEKVRYVLFSAGLLTLIISSLLIVLTLVFGRAILQDNYKHFLYVLPLVFLVPLTSLFDGIYRGLKNFKRLSVISLVVGAISVVTSYFLTRSLGLSGALLSQILLYVLTLVGLFLGNKNHVYKMDFKIAKEIAGYSLVYGLAVVGYYLFAKIDVLILGQLGYIKEIATYELLNKIFWLLLFPFSVIGQVIAPDFARLSAKKEFKRIYESVKRYTFVFTALAILLSTLLYIVLPWIIRIFFSAYLDTVFFKILPISAFIFLINISTTSIDSGIIVPTGYASIMTWCYIVLGVVNIGLALFLHHLFGYIGIVWATLVSSLTMAFLVRTMFFIKIRKLL